MTTSMVSKHSRGALRFAALSAAAAILAACDGGGVTTPAPPSGGGGGTTVTATPYLLYASNYVVFPAQTMGAFLGSIQGGNVYAASTTPDVAYGNYSASQNDINATQFYNIQYQFNAASLTNAKDNATVSVDAPGTGMTFTSRPYFDISQANTLLITMGNTYTAGDAPGTTGGNANVFTIALTNDTSLAGDNSQATAVCVFNQNLVTVGRANPASATPTPLGVYSYEIPLASFNCGSSSLAKLQSTGITGIAVQIYPANNPGMVAGELDTIAVGYIGFTM